MLILFLKVDSVVVFLGDGSDDDLSGDGELFNASAWFVAMHWAGIFFFIPETSKVPLQGTGQKIQHLCPIPNKYNHPFL